VIADTFRAFGAETVTTTANQILGAMQAGKVDAHENALAVIEGFKLYEATNHIMMTNHIWSGFNLMAHRPTWLRLPEGIRDVITRTAATYVRRQRTEQQAFNDSLVGVLGSRGITFHQIDQAAFRRRLPGVYSTWKEKVGSRGWAMIEAEVGKLG
jgi:TRAP-type C4-dicarboxylate transport system substrate-binding protein